MIANFLPSPALSACESLDDQDLDALLAGLGQLSHFATPSTKKDAVTVQVEEVEEDESYEEEDTDTIDCTLVLYTASP